MTLAGQILPLSETVIPDDQAGVARAITEAARTDTPVYPFAGCAGLRYGVVPTRPGVGLSTGQLTRLVDHAVDDMTITVGAGMTVADLRRLLASRGQRLPVDVCRPDESTVGGLVAIHQFVRVGDYAFIGGKSAVVKDIPPYVIASGDRATLHGLNQVGLTRQGFTAETISKLKKTYRIIFRIGLTLNEAIERVTAEVEQIPEVRAFLEFLKTTERGITR